MAESVGTRLIQPIVTNDTLDTYPTHYDEFGKGGYRSVALIVDRDAITLDRQVVGMLVNVRETNIIYKLITTAETLAPSDWLTLVLGGDAAVDITYDPSSSSLIATNVQAAIDELDNDIQGLSLTADNITYDPSSSSLIATDVQAAVDELDGDITLLDSDFRVVEGEILVVFDGGVALDYTPDETFDGGDSTTTVFDREIGGLLSDQPERKDATILANFVGGLVMDSFDLSLTNWLQGPETTIWDKVIEMDKGIGIDLELSVTQAEVDTSISQHDINDDAHKFDLANINGSVGKSFAASSTLIENAVYNISRLMESYSDVYNAVSPAQWIEETNLLVDNTEAMAGDSSYFYAITRNGQVWRTPDLSTAWTQLTGDDFDLTGPFNAPLQKSFATDGFGNLVVGRVDSANNNLLVSTDWGATWTKVNTPDIIPGPVSCNRADTIGAVRWGLGAQSLAAGDYATAWVDAGDDPSIAGNWNTQLTMPTAAYTDIGPCIRTGFWGVGTKDKQFWVHRHAFAFSSLNSNTLSQKIESTYNEPFFSIDGEADTNKVKFVKDVNFHNIGMVVTANPDLTGGKEFFPTIADASQRGWRYSPTWDRVFVLEDNKTRYSLVLPNGTNIGRISLDFGTNQLNLGDVFDNGTNLYQFQVTLTGLSPKIFRCINL